MVLPVIVSCTPDVVYFFQRIIAVFRVNARIYYRSTVDQDIISIIYGKQFFYFCIINRLCKQVAKEIIGVGGTNSQVVFTLGKSSRTVALVNNF